MTDLQKILLGTFIAASSLLFIPAANASQVLAQKCTELTCDVPSEDDGLTYFEFAGKSGNREDFECTIVSKNAHRAITVFIYPGGSMGFIPKYVKASTRGKSKKFTATFTGDMGKIKVKRISGSHHGSVSCVRIL